MGKACNDAYRAKVLGEGPDGPGGGVRESEEGASMLYNVAPNGKESNLDERQYKEVRTPQFKAWAGDWELAAKQVKISNATEHNFRNNAEFMVYAKAQFMEDVQDKDGNTTRQWKSITNRDTGNSIKLSSQGINKSISNRAVENSDVDRVTHLRALGKLDEIIENSLLGETHPDKNGDPNIVEMQRYYGAVVIDGNLYRVKTTVKKVKMGKKGTSNQHYSFEVQEMELIEDRLARQEIGGIKDNADNPTSSNGSISGAKLLQGVEKTNKKGEKLLNSTKVVDENGEPLVVYRGGKKINIFDPDKASKVAMYGPAFYATPSYADAQGFGKERTGNADNVLAVYLDIRNPWVDGPCESLGYPKEATMEQARELVDLLASKGLVDGDIILAKWNDGRVRSLLGALADAEYEGVERGRGEWWHASDIVQDALKELGYDGVIGRFDSGDGHMVEQVAAFEPNQIKSATENNGEFSRENPDIRYSEVDEEDRDYMDAVERGDTAKASRMVAEAAKRAMPDTKVVDENGEPLVVYHQTNAKRWINRETGEDWEKLDWKKKQEWEDKTDEEWQNAWEEKDFYEFDDRYARQSIEMPAIFFSPNNDPYHEFGQRTIAAYLDIKNPAINPDIPNRGVTDTAGRDAMEALKAQGYDGFIRTDEEGNEYREFIPKTTFYYGEKQPIAARTNPRVVNFNAVRAGERDEQTVYLTNTGLNAFAPTLIANAPFSATIPQSLIQPGETVEFTAVFEPTCAGLFEDELLVDCGGGVVLEVALNGTALEAGQEFTICDGGAKNQYVPFNGIYVDDVNTMGQMIYPAEKLTEMKDGKIVALTFYTESAINMKNAVIELSMMNTDQEEFVQAVPMTGLTAVASADIIKGENQITFELNQPFAYTGGNLAIQAKVATVGQTATTFFLGEATDNYASLSCFKSWSGDKKEHYQFLPKATFTYQQGTPEVIRGDVDKSGDVSIADVTALIDMLLSGEAMTPESDCDNSGDMSIADVTCLIDYLLSGVWND